MIPIALTGFLIAFALTPAMRAWGNRRGRVDIPNVRSSHTRPTPRTGGYAIFAGIIAAFVVGPALRERSLILSLTGATLLVLLAGVDEVRELPRALRLIAQVAVSAATIVAGGMLLDSIHLPFAGTIHLGMLAAPFTLLWVIGVTNAYNFMDGLNGVASAETIVCSLFLTVLLLGRGDAAGAALAAATGTASAGFLPWNLPSGSIFMGDTGSTTLGFLIALLVVRASQQGVPFLAAALPLAPFLIDASVTLLRRALQGERFFSTPHRSHAYQRLQQSGWSHGAVTCVWTLLALASGTLGIVINGASDVTAAAAVVMVLAIHATVFLWIDSKRPVAS